MSLGIECLLADDPAEAASLAGQLAKLNQERREIETRMQAQAVEIATGLRFDVAGDESLGLCLFDEDWHQGVVGLVAGRIKDRLNRPVVAFARAEDGSLRGSARSVAGVNVRDALDSIATRHPGLVQKFGGHAMAAGLTLLECDLERFRLAFAGEIAARADGDTLQGVIYSDGCLTIQELCIDTARALRGAGPWGQGFPEPIFDGDFRILDATIVGGKHLKMQLADSTSGALGVGALGVGAFGAGASGVDASAAFGIDAIAFGYLGGVVEDDNLRVGARISIAYRLEVNEYRGAERVQLNCQHLKLAERVC